MQCNHNGPHQREARVSKWEKGNLMMTAELGMMASKDGGSGHEPRNADSSQKLLKTKKQIFLQRLQEDPVVLTHDLSPMRLILEFGSPEM